MGGIITLYSRCILLNFEEANLTYNPSQNTWNFTRHLLARDRCNELKNIGAVSPMTVVLGLSLAITEVCSKSLSLS